MIAFAWIYTYVLSETTYIFLYLEDLEIFVFYFLIFFQRSKVRFLQIRPSNHKS
jgi:hypothetical protein